MADPRTIGKQTNKEKILADNPEFYSSRPSTGKTPSGNTGSNGKNTQSYGSNDNTVAAQMKKDAEHDKSLIEKEELEKFQKELENVMNNAEEQIKNLKTLDDKFNNKAVNSHIVKNKDGGYYTPEEYKTRFLNTGNSVLDERAKKLFEDNQDIFENYETGYKIAQLQKSSTGDKVLTPEEYAKSLHVNISDNDQIAKNSPRNLEKLLEDNPEFSDEINEIIDKTNKVNDYIKKYNDAYQHVTGMTYDDYKDTVKVLEETVYKCEIGIKGIDNYIIQLPYLEIVNSEQYKNWQQSKSEDLHITYDKQLYDLGMLKVYINGVEVDVNDIDPMIFNQAVKDGKIPATVSPNFLSLTSNPDMPNNLNYKALLEFFGVDAILEKNGIKCENNAYELQVNSLIDNYLIDYMSAEEKDMYSFLYATRGKKAADEYYNTLKMDERAGVIWAQDYLNTLNELDEPLKKILIASTAFSNSCESVGENIAKLSNKEGEKPNAEDIYRYILSTGLDEDSTKLYNLFSSLGAQFPTYLVGGLPGILLQSLSAAGASKSQALNNGLTENDAWGYAAMNFLLEFGVESLIGKVPGLDSNVKLSLKNIASEGASEALTSLISSYFDSEVFDGEFDLTTAIPDALKEGFLGAVNALVYGGIDTAKTTYSNIDNANINTFGDFVDLLKIVNLDKSGVDDSKGTTVFKIDSTLLDGSNSSDIINSINKIFPGMPIVDSNGNIIFGNIDNSNINNNNLNDIDFDSAPTIEMIDFGSEPTVELIDFKLDDITPTLDMLSTVVNPNIIDKLSNNDLSDIDFGSEPTIDMVDFEVNEITPLLPISNAKKFSDYAQFVQEYSNQTTDWIDSLTSQELKLIKNYIGESDFSSYVTMNGVMRGTAVDVVNSVITLYHAFGEPNPRIYTFDQYFQTYGETVQQFIIRTTDEAIALNNAISRNKFKEDTVVARGCDFNSLSRFGVLESDSPQQIMNKLGKYYTDFGFMSCTPVADGGFTNKEVNFIMTCKEGMSFGDFFPWNAGEQEILLGLGSTFSVDNVKIENGKIMIYMTSV